MVSHLEKDDDPGGRVVVGAVGVHQAHQVQQRREQRAQVRELLRLQTLEVRGERLEVGGDVLSLLHGRNHVPVHRLEGGIVGAVRQVEDACHLDSYV